MGNENNDFDITGGVLQKYRGSATSVTIPDGVTEIGGEAFRDCRSLAQIHFGGTKEQWEAV